jgi:hypothetical protein
VKILDDAFAKSGRKYTKSFCFAKLIYKLFPLVFITFAAA